MSNDSMKDRGRALEEEWARKQNAEAIDKMKKGEKADPKKGGSKKKSAGKKKATGGSECKCGKECACNKNGRTGCGCGC